MPPKRAPSAKEKKTKAKTDNTSGDRKFLCRLVQPVAESLTVDEGTKEYYLMQIRDLENRIAR